MTTTDHISLIFGGILCGFFLGILFSLFVTNTGNPLTTVGRAKRQRAKLIHARTAELMEWDTTNVMRNHWLTVNCLFMPKK